MKNNIIKNPLDTFVLGFWQYLNFGKQDLTVCTKEWKELFMNLAYTFNFRPEVGDKVEDMVMLLDNCLSNGYQAIAVDNRLHWRNLKHNGEKKYREDFLQIMEEYGNHEGVFAFMVGDEPFKDDFEPAIRAIQIIQSITDKPAIVNFNPSWFGEEFEQLFGFKGEEYFNVIDDFIKRSGLKVLLYDYYGAMAKHDQEHCINSYFRQLVKFHDVAKANGIPCWNSGLCLQHWDFRLPSREDLRWQLSTACAHGIKGVLWFELYQGALYKENWEGAPYNYYGEKNPMWLDLMEVQREFQCKYGEIIPYLDLEAVHHYGPTYGGVYYYFNGCDENIKNFENRFRTSATISRFVDKRNGDLYYMVVNNSQVETDRFTIQFDDSHSHCNTCNWLSPGGSFLVKYGGKTNE